jgi:hypothetical protein
LVDTYFRATLHLLHDFERIKDRSIAKGVFAMKAHDSIIARGAWKETLAMNPQLADANQGRPREPIGNGDRISPGTRLISLANREIFFSHRGC